MIYNKHNWHDDTRPWNEYTDQDFQITTDTVPMDGRKLQKLRLAAEIQTSNDFADAVHRATKRKVDEGTSRHIETFKDKHGKCIPKPTQLGTAYRFAYTLQCTIHDLLVDERPRSPRDGELNAEKDRVQTIVTDLSRNLPSNHLHKRIAASLLRSTAHSIEVRHIPHFSVTTTISAREYPNALADLTEEERKHTKAFADLTDHTELAFWKSTPRPERTWVRERVFWISWEQMFNPEEFSTLVNVFRDQASFRPKDYSVRVGVMNAELKSAEHPLGTSAVGKHLLLIGSDSVGGYRGGHTSEKQYVLITDQDLHTSSQEYYDLATHCSVNMRDALRDVDPPDDATAVGDTIARNRLPLASVGRHITTVSPEIVLDATGLTDLDEHMALTYSWHTVQRAATIVNPTHAGPRVQFTGDFGDYVFEVTVRDSQGAASTARVTTTYAAPTTALRRALNSLIRIGDYDEDWGDHQDRPERYFTTYDYNIHTWIPWYVELNSFCAGRTIKELYRRYNRRPSPPSLFEIGYGTGNLTQMLFDAIAYMNKGVNPVYAPPFVGTFYGLDAASQMRKIVNKRFAGTDVLHRFNTGVFKEFQALDLAGGAHKVDVLCGSLVLHDLIELQIRKDPATDRVTVTHKLPEVLRTVERLVTEDGVVVFADIFRPDSDADWEQEMTCWKEEMERRGGMTQGQINKFMRRNPEMAFPLRIGEVIELAPQYGFEAEFLRLEQRGRGSQSPFRLCILTRIDNRRAQEGRPV
jgi:SAM-dependent methyltransferase